MPFIKNGWNEPYVPGSSLKGSLRSRILRGAVLESSGLRDDFSKKVQIRAIQSKKSAGREIEDSIFVKPGVSQARSSNYDLNRVLVVGDSSVLQFKDLN